MKNDRDIDWGIATPEGYNDAKREALHVLNVNFLEESNRNRVLRFVIGRIMHFAKHLPTGASQRVRFDLRGQRISNRTLEQVRRAILEASMERGISVKVEFLTN